MYTFYTERLRDAYTYIYILSYVHDIKYHHCKRVLSFYDIIDVSAVFW